MTYRRKQKNTELNIQNSAWHTCFCTENNTNNHRFVGKSVITLQLQNFIPLINTHFPHEFSTFSLGCNNCTQTSFKTVFASHIIHVYVCATTCEFDKEIFPFSFFSHVILINVMTLIPFSLSLFKLHSIFFNYLSVLITVDMNSIFVDTVKFQ